MTDITARVATLRPDARPLYAQAVDALYTLIESDVYRPGDVLPSEAGLARQLGVSRSTVREAVGHLVRDGLITRKQGIGTFVAEQPQKHLTGGLERLLSFRTLAQMKGTAVEMLERTVETTVATPAQAEVLGVPVESELVRVQVTEAIDGRTMAYLDSVIPIQSVKLEALRAAEGSLLDYLVAEVGLPLAYTRTELRAENAGKDLAGWLRVAEGVALLHLTETLYGEDDQPIALSQNYFLTDSFDLMIVRRVVRRAAGHS